jgi:endoglucanase
VAIGVHKDTLMSLLAAHGGPGFEEAEVAPLIQQALQPYVDRVWSDRMGNVIALRSGTGESRPRVMLAAHMDEIALVITRIESGGFLRVWQTGGFDPRVLAGQEVIVHGKRPVLGIVGSKPPHLTTPEERNRPTPLEDLYIDVAMPEARVRELIRVGDRVTIRRQPIELLNDRLAGKALDNRASLAILLECLHELQTLRHTADVYAVATVQEEVGLRGARVAVEGVKPDIAIAIDVTFAEFPGQSADRQFTLGKGPAIAFGPTIHPKVFAGLRQIADDYGIPWQLELTQGPTGTDASAMQIAMEGVACGLVGVPIRYMHTSVETVSCTDIVHCGRLLAHYIARLDTAQVEGLTCY